MNLLDEAIKYYQSFGMSTIPLIGKKSIIDWKEYQNGKMKIDDIIGMAWDHTIKGLAAICGIDYLVCIDLDYVKSDKILLKTLEYLNVGENYKWIVKTKNGYHIWIRITDIKKIFEFLGRAFAYKKFYPVEKELLKQLELRVINCYAVLPPSLHPQGGTYEFHNGYPDYSPNDVDVDKIITLLKEQYYPVNKEKIKNKDNNLETDIRYLPAAIKYLKEFRLGYEIWRDCCFALCSLGEDGRGYFRDLSQNKFYLDDTIQSIDKQYDECLKRYDNNKTKLNTLFYYAIEFGFRYGRKSDLYSKLMLTYPLSLMQCDDDVLIKRFISYGIIKGLQERSSENVKQLKITEIKIKVILDKYKIDFIKPKEVIDTFREIGQKLGDYEKKHGKDAYGLIGLDFLIDCKKGKFRYGLLRNYAAVRAILGRIIKFKAIPYSRLILAHIGYKSKAVYENSICKADLVCSKTLYRNFKKLTELRFIACFYYGRKTYFSTYYDQDRLKIAVEKRILEKDEKKLQSSDVEFRKRIDASRKKLTLKKLESHSC